MPYRCTYKPEILPPFTGKERDRETGFSYFGARYYDSDLSGLFLSVDPMSDKYPSVSPYVYCAWNPVILIDPNGNDGVKIIDKQKYLITLTATYYVTSQPAPGVPNSAYSPSEIESMQNDINKELNSHGFIYEIDGEKYNVCFDLKFVDAGSSWVADHLAKEDPIGNSLSVLPENAYPFFKVEDNGDGTESHTGGVTLNNMIVMNSKFDNTRRRIHEIFHTLFFDNDNADSGIGNYVPGVDMPNQNDINILLNNPKLPERVVRTE